MYRTYKIEFISVLRIFLPSRVGQCKLMMHDLRAL